MKTKSAPVSLTIIVLAVLAFAGCSEPEHKGGQNADTAKKQYTCEMHPEVVQDQPGDCPKCHMKLTEKK
jgi:PBP1b-binding outer membrane lipoprotein LpoB